FYVPPGRDAEPEGQPPLEPRHVPRVLEDGQAHRPSGGRRQERIRRHDEGAKPMKKPRDWLWVSDRYYTKTQALREFPELQAVDPRLPGLMLQVESAEAMIEQ